MPKIERLHARGTIFRYPYAWRPEVPEYPQPKDRPVCLLLEAQNVNGVIFLALVAISDQPNSGRGMSVPVPASELERAGLSETRQAYVHLDQYNSDRFDNSYNYNPRARPLGSFSPGFTAKLAGLLAQNIREKRAMRIDRE